jgi:hypothetical protein
MTTLRCPCGVLMTGRGRELLTAVESHLAESHRDLVGRGPSTGPRHPGSADAMAQLDDDVHRPADQARS